MRLAIVLSIVLAGCAKKPAAKTPANAPAAAAETKESGAAPVEKADAPDRDDPKRMAPKSDPCEGGE